jgi:hypothetical protein
MKRVNLLLGLLIITILPLVSSATTGDSIVSVGVLFFFTFLAMIFTIGGYLLLDKPLIRVLGAGFILIGVIFLYSASGMASLFLTNISNALGGESQATGLFIFLSRLIKYSVYAVPIYIAFVVVKIYNFKKLKSNNSDGWDENQYK